MKITTVRVLRNISKIVLVLTGLLLLGFLGYTTYLSIRFKPYKVRVSNVTDSAFTVSWITDKPMPGVVYYGEKDNFLPGVLSWIGKKKAFDDRDLSNAQTECISKFNEKASKSRDENFTVDTSEYDCNQVKVVKKGTYYTHHITVPNLEAEKEYYFRVGNGFVSFKSGKTDGVEYIDGEMPAISEFKQKTLLVFKDVSSPKPAYGTSFNFYRKSDGFIGTKNNFDSIIFLKTFKDGIEYPLMSAVTNNDGGWSIDLANVRDEENNVLSLENSSFEFIPQVDNARPGSNGVVKYEDIEFPLRILGNNSDDWGDSTTEIQGENIQLRNLLNNLINKSYAAASCYCSSMNCSYVNRVSCEESNCHPSRKVCCLSKGLDANCNPLPVAPKVTCYKDKCPEEKAVLESCNSTYPNTSPPDCRDCFKCEGGQLTTVPSNARGYCPGGYSERRPDCTAPTTKTCYSCKSDGGIAERDMASCSGIWKENPNDLNCSPATEPTVNCYCTSNRCGNKLNKKGTTCKASDGCFSSKTLCVDHLDDNGGTGNKTCCKINIKGGCSCLEKQKKCTGLYKEYRSQNDCKDAKVTPIGKPIRGQTGCVGGQTIPGYVPVRVTGVVNQSIVEKKGILDMLGFKALAQVYGDEWESVCENETRGCYTTLSNGECRTCSKGKSGCEFCMESDTCDSDKMLCYTSTPHPVNESFTSECELGETQNGKKCKEYWRHTDCAVVYRYNDPGAGYTSKRDECIGSRLKLATGAVNSHLLANHCIVKVGDNRYETAPNMTRTIVSGGCNSCYAEYRNKITGAYCGNVKVDGVFCGNPVGEAGCDNQRVQVINCGEECEAEKCVCPSNCEGNGGMTIGEKGDPEAGKECGKKKEEQSSERGSMSEGTHICKYFVSTGGQISPEFILRYNSDGTENQEYVNKTKNLQDCSTHEMTIVDEYQYCIGDCPKSVEPVVYVCEYNPQGNRVDAIPFQSTNLSMGDSGLSFCDNPEFVRSLLNTNNTNNMICYSKGSCSESLNITEEASGGISCPSGMISVYVTETNGLNQSRYVCMRKEIAEAWNRACDSPFPWDREGLYPEIFDSEGSKLNIYCRCAYKIPDEVIFDALDGDETNPIAYRCYKLETGNQVCPNNVNPNKDVVYTIAGAGEYQDKCRVLFDQYCTPTFQSYAFLYCYNESKNRLYSYTYKKGNAKPSCPKGSVESFFQYPDRQCFYLQGELKIVNTRDEPEYLNLEYQQNIRQWRNCAEYQRELKSSNNFNLKKIIKQSYAEDPPENEEVLLYFPESGVYSVETSKGKVSLMGGENRKYFTFLERNGEEGYQSPKDPSNPQENEDLFIPISSIMLSEPQRITTSKDIALKRGINIISFNFFPSLGQEQMDSKKFLQIVNQTGRNVSRISYFSGGKWDGGNTYDFETGEVKGVPFPLSTGRGYVVIAERNTTITVPGYEINTPIPIAFSQGTNLIGIHGHSKAYMASTLIKSINSTDGLKSDSVTWWPTYKGMYQGYLYKNGEGYGEDFPISPLNGYFVRISEFKPKENSCRSILWNPGRENHGECGTVNN